MTPKKIGLTAYGFSVQDDANTRIELNTFREQNETFISVLHSYLSKIKNMYENDSQNDSVFLFEKIEVEEEFNEQNQSLYSIMYLRVKTGDYGIESELVDSDTGEIAHVRNEKEADVMPFGAVIIVPSGKMDNGIIILQSISRYGIKTALHKRMDVFVKTINPEYRFTMGTIIPKIMLNRFLKDGVLQKIRMIRFNIPTDIAERYGINAGVKDIIEERVIRKPRGFLINKAKEIEDWRNGNITYDKLIQIDNFEYDDLKMEFKLGRTLKTISLKNIDNLQVCEDITNEVQLKGGHPIFESLMKIMKDTGEFYLRAKGLLIEK